MSQPLNDDFNNNNQNSDSNIQYANNNEGAYQSTSHDNSLEAESVNEQSSNAQQQPEDEEERPEDKEQSDAGGDVVNPAEKQPEGVSEEAPSNADNSDNDDKDKESVTEPDVPDNPLDDLPKETASNADNNNNHASANAPEPSSADVSKDNNENFSEIIQKKIDAVKDFAFCQKKVSFPFCQKKYKDIPVYPYVAALTGHRDAVITDAVKDTAKKQLRSLAQAWDNACKGRSWLIIPKKTAPLIVLIGLGDGESGKLWAEIAADLRDSEKCNIKIIAVAGMPLKDMVNILSKHTSFLSDKKDFLDAKKSFDYILEKAEGLIELPYNQDVKEYIKLYENLEMNCTGDNAAHSDDIFKILFKESKAFQDIQYKEYRKFMCIHSHVLLALTENATSWESANLAGIDINELNNDSSDNAISKDSLLIPFKEKDDARKALKELNSQITELKNRGCKPQKFEELISSFETLAGSLFKKFTEPIPRTNAMIFYKLLGNVDSALVPDNRKINGISFTSIGPVVCIHTKHKTPDTETENPQNSTADVTILVKDQPNDVSADLIMKFKWNNKDISQFNEIKDVITQCGAINKRLFNKSYFSDFPEKDVVKEFQETQSNNKQQHNVEQASIDESALSLVKHHNSSKKLSQHYYWWMKFWTRTFAIFAVLIFSLFGIGSVTGSKSIIFYSNCGIGALFAALGIYSWFNIHRYYHYFEALANGLKVQIYWNLAEVNEDVPGQFYLHQISTIAWLRVAFNGLLATESLSSYNNEIKSLKQSQTCSQNYTFIKRNWVDSALSQIAGKRNYNFIERFCNKLEKLTHLIEPVLKVLSPAGGYGAFLGYIVLNSLLIKGPVFSVFIKIIFCCLILLFSVIAVYNAYRKSSLKELDIKRKHQLLYPYRRAQLLYGIKMNYWENSQKCLHENAPSQDDKENSDWKVINNSYQECQKILEDLGRIELAINAEWLLGLKDRDFNVLEAFRDFKRQYSKLENDTIMSGDETETMDETKEEP